MSVVNILLDVPNDAEFYLETSARLRGVSRPVLLKRLLEIVLRDQLMLSIFDDDNKPSDKTAARTKRAGGRPKHTKPPKDRLFDSLNYVSKSVPMKRGPSPTYNWGRKKTTSFTRAEMEADLRQAILNTGGELNEKQ